MLGFGLWKAPAVTIAVELALVVVGAILYWQAATQTARAAGGAAAGRARLVAGLVLVAGLLTLAVDALIG